MAQTLRELKRRLKSIKNTRQLTRAMELVATSRARRAMQAASQARDYALAAWQIITSLAERVSEKEHPLLQKRDKVKNICFLLLTTNRGLCGSLNNQIINKVLPYLKSDKQVSFVTWGRKGREIIKRFSKNLLADFEKTDQLDAVIEARQVAKFLISLFLKKEVDEVWLAYADFISTLKQEPNLWRLLPLKPATEPSGQTEKHLSTSYLFEPDTHLVLEAILPRVVQLKVYQTFLETYASEQAGRMVAMKNATDNASGLIDELTLIYNQARQAGITKELAEISAARAVLE